MILFFTNSLSTQLELDMLKRWIVLKESKCHLDVFSVAVKMQPKLKALTIIKVCFVMNKYHPENLIYARVK